MTQSIWVYFISVEATVPQVLKDGHPSTSSGQALAQSNPSTPFVPRTSAARRCETAGSGQRLRDVLV
ncbi:MAG: hypothetical protein QMD04_00310 [Anaerolineales bacterium]|nr:hypothetical protein [Anaerolineales bacterium]